MLKEEVGARGELLAFFRSRPLGDTRRSAGPPSGWDSAVGEGVWEVGAEELGVVVVQVGCWSCGKAIIIVFVQHNKVAGCWNHGAPWPEGPCATDASPGLDHRSSRTEKGVNAARSGRSGLNLGLEIIVQWCVLESEPNREWRRRL